MVVPWKTENVTVRDLPSDSVQWSKTLLLLNSPDDLSAFLTTVWLGQGFGVSVGKASLPSSFFHIDEATSHMMELQSCGVFQCQLQSAPGLI